MSSKAALIDDHVNGGVIEIEFGRPVEGIKSRNQDIRVRPHWKFEEFFRKM